MGEKDLREKIAVLESANDQMYSELSHVDGLMRMLGFQDGLETVKETALSLYEERNPDFCEEDFE